jgi:hypothetical protein
MNKIDPKELVPAAQVAGADELSQDFWRQFAKREQIRARHTSNLVQPRPLTAPPKNNTF